MSAGSLRQCACPEKKCLDKITVNINATNQLQYTDSFPPFAGFQYFITADIILSGISAIYQWMTDI